jgi:hypothetical protein
MKPRRVVLLVFAACIVATAARAQPPADVTIQVGECIALEDAAERHACFDRQVEAALEDTGGAVDAESAPASAEKHSPPTQPAPIVSTIAALSQLRPNVYLIELENGQTWRQVTSQRYTLRVGREVTLHATRWGDTYRLQAAGANDFIQVEKVR